jgi:formylglycine-generating enzyme required for sulfatase activity
MKQHYKIYLCALLLVGAVGTMTIGALGADKPKLAVLVVGMGSAAKSDAFAVRLGSDLNRDNEYELVTKDNNTAVADMLAALRTQATPVDTGGLAAWGKANGIDLVQLVVQATHVSGMRTFRVAQLVDCNTGKLSGRGTYRMDFTPKGVDTNAVIELIAVAGGAFAMGCSSSRDGTCDREEQPLHTVRVNNFHIGKYEITQAQWKAVMGSLPSSLTSDIAYLGDNKPVIYVSHDDIVGKDGFLEKLNALTGKTYRLPTEAEWEYAARGCSAGMCESYPYSGNNTIGNVAWYFISVGNSNNPNGPQPVGEKSPNALGIYDMSGNVWEWCSDWYSDTYYTTDNNPLDNPENTTPDSDSERVTRGGSWATINISCRVATRVSLRPNYGRLNYGFRVVLP